MSKKRPKNNGISCTFCGHPDSTPFKIAGILLRNACDKCFVTRCMSCGTVCVDESGRLGREMKLRLGSALYCNDCSSGREY